MHVALARRHAQVRYTFKFSRNEMMTDNIMPMTKISTTSGDFMDTTMTMTKNQPLRRLYGYNYDNDKIDHFGDFMDTTMTMTKSTTSETLWIQLHCMIMTKFVYSYNDLRTSVYKQ